MSEYKWPNNRTFSIVNICFFYSKNDELASDHFIAYFYGFSVAMNSDCNLVVKLWVSLETQTSSLTIEILRKVEGKSESWRMIVAKIYEMVDLSQGD